MRYAIRGLVAFCVLWASTDAVEAGCNVVRSAFVPYSSSYVAPYVEQKVIVNKITVFDYNPGVAVGYLYPYVAAVAPAAVAPAMPAPAAAPSPCSAEVQSLRQELERLKAAIAPAAPPPMAPVPDRPTAPAAPKPTMLGQKCAGCHTAVGETPPKDKAPALFADGVPTLWTPDLLGKVVREVASGRMPRGSKLTQAEFTDLMTEVMSLASK